ncbi:cytochrome c-type biogenesis protein CcmF [Janthinobacterium sp. HH01]|uniref:heme lyase CcmF/NrfE family subunit n=1 Tax=Janthinobacterium sp. HH01 TaxID=1198452 RepID=UPI0002AEDF6D|nr:heme lyase CcmF/NrfE family subunit [Janthinobacterium sp. HH01]ELX13152.1 cytochrome c-type biogenesis protein CcmF [Janthinobacterium sp. HH01]
MIAELGNFALMLALALALVQASLPLLGAWRGNQRWIALARPAAAGQFVFVSAAFGCLLAAFAVNDFSVAYVASNSNSMLPIYYRVAAVWGGHEGSLLLWVQILAGWTAAVAVFSRRLPPAMTARVLGVMAWISVGFLLFMLFTSNPFDRLLPAARDGRDLNPLLQDFGMIIHPPLLYMGYVGFSVAFAFAIAALLGGQLDAAWARWSRPWTLVAWAFLTLGIFMGSFWAYYELGWGGWWFWDAVENASFMPWLVGTALIHSLAVTEKRGSFKNWTVLLAIVAFSLSLLGTFLVRSGVLTSVHAFATDPRRGLFILVFLAIVIGGSLALYAWRAPSVGMGGRFALFSRESLLLLNNVLLLTAAATVLLGTLYPLLLDALDLGKISVGAPYFEAVFVPLMLPVLALMAAAPFVEWRTAELRPVLARVSRIGQASLLFGLAAWLGWKLTPAVAGGLMLAVWIVLGTALHLFQRVATAGEGVSLGHHLGKQPLSYWGMLAAHAGVAVFVVGVTLVKGGEVSEDASLRVGDSIVSNGWRYSFTALEKVDGPNYIAARATFEVRGADGRVLVLRPEKRYYTVQQMPMTEAAIDRGFTRDIYLSLGEPGKDGAWAVRVQSKPFVGWIWAGCLIIASGGLLAASDKRYRLARQASVSASAAAVPI